MYVLIVNRSNGTSKFYSFKIKKYRDAYAEHLTKYIIGRPQATVESIEIIDPAE